MLYCVYVGLSDVVCYVNVVLNMSLDMEKTVEEVFRQLPSAIKGTLISRDGTLIYSNIDRNILKRVLKLFKKHKNVPVNGYEPEELDEGTLIFYGLTADKIFVVFSTLTLPEILVHSRNVVETLRKKLDELFKSFIEELSREVDEETKQRYGAVYELSPKYKSIEEVLPLVSWMGQTAATIIANIDKKLSVWQLTLLLQKAGTNITFEEMQKMLEDLKEKGYVTLSTEE